MNIKTPFLRLWGIPLFLGAISLLGLICALVGDGFWDAFSWGCLGILVAVIVYYGWMAGKK